MKNTIKIIIAACMSVLSFGLSGCYEDYVKDFAYTSVFFGSQRPVRTLVTTTDRDELVFRIGVGLGGVRENVKGYEVKYKLEPELLDTISGANRYKLLPAGCYTIENDGDFTFYVQPGKFIGDCEVRINKNAFVALEGSTANTWALPLRLLSTTADQMVENLDWTVIVIKYKDELGGDYYSRGWQAKWNGTDIDEATKTEYYDKDWNQNKVIRTLTTISPTEFSVEGMGSFQKPNNAPADLDHFLIKLIDGKVKLERKSATSNNIEDLGSNCEIIDEDTVFFTLDYVYTYEGVSYRVHEQLKLRQNVEKGLRFEEWT